ncbi:hypothetical protein B0H17DRAFT_1339210 [Mycena rosella]|uniref:DUF6534 domain-containing protein n=1 Tax=Mycena rosella TaxID=1033263 RepID=A0AAD7C9L4_MYCRO|nr:hypothetical protein B0H17DRAFT_1339210 [Mycena rosella]
MSNLYDLNLGCLLVSSWVNMFLFALELKEIFKYFGRYKNDPAFNRIVVLAALTGDTLTVVACLSSTYLYMVTHWGEDSYLATQPWGIAGYVVGTGITGAAVQIFLTRMVFSVTKQWIWLPMIGLFIAVGIAGAGATAGSLIINTSIASRGGLVKWATVWLSGCIAADTTITIILVIRFQTLKSDFNFAVTNNLLHRLSITAVRNGSITTAVTIVTVIVFKVQPEMNSALMLEITIGRVYSLCMLSNLNSRIRLPDNSSCGIESSKGSPFRLTVSHGDTKDTVVRVQKDVQYTTDDDNSSSIPMDSLAFGRRKQEDAESGEQQYVTKDASSVEF